jgi:hypothetical protein
MKVVVAVVEYISNASSVLVSVQGGERDVVFTGVYMRFIDWRYSQLYWYFRPAM